MTEGQIVYLAGSGFHRKEPIQWLQTLVHYIEDSQW